MPTIALADGKNATDAFQCNATADINLNGDKYGLRPVDLPINKLWVPQNIYTWNMSTQPLNYTGMLCAVCRLPTCVTCSHRLLGQRHHARRPAIPHPHIWLSIQCT